MLRAAMHHVILSLKQEFLLVWGKGEGGWGRFPIVSFFLYQRIFFLFFFYSFFITLLRGMMILRPMFNIVT